jgi:hypothetical protein
VGETAKEFDQVGKWCSTLSSVWAPFEVVERKGLVAYRLALPHSLRRMHDVFHVSILRKYVSDHTHVIDMSYLQVSDEGAIMTEPIRILDH